MLRNYNIIPELESYNWYAYKEIITRNGYYAQTEFVFDSWAGHGYWQLMACVMPSWHADQRQDFSRIVHRVPCQRSVQDFDGERKRINAGWRKMLRMLRMTEESWQYA